MPSCVQRYDSPRLAARRDLPRSDVPRVKSQDEIHHQHPAAARRFLQDSVGLLQCSAHGFLQEDVLVDIERRARDLRVRFVGSGYGDYVYVVLLCLEHFGVVFVEPSDTQFSPRLLKRSLPDVAQGYELNPRVLSICSGMQEAELA